MIYIKFSILIILIIILIKKKSVELFNVNDKNWLGYRLGDIIKYWNNLKYQKGNFEYINSIKYKYPNSIGDIYLKKNISKKKNNFDLLFKIIDDKNKNIKKKEISIHLRIGDVLNLDKNKNLIYSSKYVTKVTDIEKIIPFLKNKKVNIFYGSHYNLKKDISEKYLNEIRTLLNKNNIKIIENNSGNPDYDLLNMCNSKIFIQSGGGFSNIIAKYIKSRGGKVINPRIKV